MRHIVLDHQKREVLWGASLCNVEDHLMEVGHLVLGGREGQEVGLQIVLVELLHVPMRSGPLQTGRL